jgi:hypothetical protein
VRWGDSPHLSYNDDNKIELKTHEISTNIVLIITFVLIPAFCLNLLVDAPRFDPLESELLFESGEELGYNWTEGNITVFETEAGWNTAMYEEQCANGVEEACNYMLLREVAREAFFEEEDGMNVFFNACCIIWPLSILNLLLFGEKDKSWFA